MSCVLLTAANHNRATSCQTGGDFYRLYLCFTSLVRCIVSYPSHISCVEAGVSPEGGAAGSVLQSLGWPSHLHTFASQRCSMCECASHNRSQRTPGASSISLVINNNLPRHETISLPSIQSLSNTQSNRTVGGRLR